MGTERLAPADEGVEGADSEKVAAPSQTKERILDVALDLFTQQGFDGTSLREIAERVGVTKAALYYHFESKDDILLALHMRLHEVGKDALRRISDQPMTLELWSSLLDEVADQMLAQRKIFLMHERNQAALEKFHRREGHEADHEDMQSRFQEILGDPRIPLRDRIRMAASFGGLLGGLFMSGSAFEDESAEELGALLKETMHDIVSPGASVPSKAT